MKRRHSTFLLNIQTPLKSKFLHPGKAVSFRQRHPVWAGGTLDTEFPGFRPGSATGHLHLLFPQQKSARAVQSLAPHPALTLSSDMAMATRNRQEACWRLKDPGAWPGTSPALKGPQEAGASGELLLRDAVHVSCQEEAGADAAGWAKQADRRGGGSQLPYQALDYSGSQCSRVNCFRSSQPVIHPTQQQQRQASQCQPRTLHGTGHSTFLLGGAPEIVY